LLFYNQYADRERATHVLSFHDMRFEATPIEEWRARENTPRLLPDFLGPGAVYPIFRLDDWYYAPSLSETHDFLYTAAPELDTKFHRDRSLPNLIEWIKEATPPLKAAKH
jgi:hypothetical protein